ncbi:MAG TPA: hypothetical protein PKX93_02730 [bacterium]|nr:hypothetical protein [bacterium]HOL66355.1 hypothetical protein [bacterium]
MSELAEFSVGYQVMPEEDEFFWKIVADYRESVTEVYFAWPSQPSGRAPVAEEHQEQLLWELQRLRRLGVRLNLLLNASCYGEKAVSVSFSREVVALMDFLMEKVGLEVVTTMSPLVASTVKKHFPRVSRRASVNLRIGTVAGLEYVADFFESYCLQREFNRDRGRLFQLQEWARSEGKELQILANSGCLNFCSFQTFHDNAVAHEKEMKGIDSVQDLPTLCRHFYRDETHRLKFIQNSSWIRPEDIHLHQQVFSGSYKLATRMHGHPRLVLAAYSQGHYEGNLLDLLEPGFSQEWWPLILDNKRFPQEWFPRVLACDKKCQQCQYCRGLTSQVLVALNPEGADRES